MHVQEMSSGQATAAIAAQLGRSPLDPVEAAIVLEAWRGVRPEPALRIGAHAARASGAPTAPRPRRSQVRVAEGSVRQSVALLVMLAGVALWASPMIAWIGDAAFSVAWRVALPVVLATQWVVQARFAEKKRLPQLRPYGWALASVGIAGAGALAVLPASAAAVAVALVVPWAGMVVLAERVSWSASYVALVATASVVLRSGVPPRSVLVAFVVATTAIVVLAVRTVPRTSERPYPLGPSLIAGIVGAGLGGLLVIGAPGRPISEGGIAAVLMVPSVVGGLWASARLRGLWQAIPRSLRMVAFLDAGPVPRFPAVVVFASATVRYLVATCSLTVVVLFLGPLSRQGWNELAIGYALVGFAGLLATLSWSYGRRGWTIAGVGIGCGVAAASQLLDEGQIALAAGGLMACIALAWPVGDALLRIERSFATRLQIP